MTSTTKPRPTLEQRRAAHAWSVIKHVRTEKADSALLLDLETKSKRLSSRIIASGLGQALAFAFAKKDGLFFVAALTDWITDRPTELSELIAKDCLNQQQLKLIIHDFIENHLINSNALQLRDNTEEALAYLPWLSRFAEGEGQLNSGSAEDNDESN